MSSKLCNVRENKLPVDINYDFSKKRQRRGPKLLFVKASFRSDIYFLDLIDQKMSKRARK